MACLLATLNICGLTPERDWQASRAAQASGAGLVGQVAQTLQGADGVGRTRRGPEITRCRFWGVGRTKRGLRLPFSRLCWGYVDPSCWPMLRLCSSILELC